MTIQCRLLQFPVDKCHGLVLETKQGYILAINSSCCDLIKRHAFGHEMAHIVLDHMNQPQKPITEREREANRRAWEFYRAYKKEYGMLTSGADSFILEIK